MSPGPRQKAPCRDNCLFLPSFVSFCRQTFQSRPPLLLLSKQSWVSNPALGHILTTNTVLVTGCPPLPFKNPVNSFLEAQNFECELIWVGSWHKIKSEFSTSLSVAWFLLWQYSTSGIIYIHLLSPFLIFCLFKLKLISAPQRWLRMG
jgi:hypothetical protein